MKFTSVAGYKVASHNIERGNGIRSQVIQNIRRICNNPELFGLKRGNISSKDIADITGNSRVVIGWCFTKLRRAGEV